jgi:hypothetical protein
MKIPETGSLQQAAGRLKHGCTPRGIGFATNWHMRIAYIISAYKNPEQLIRLIRRLNTDTSSFLVHVDKRADKGVYCQIVSGISDLLNVYLLKRHKCYWGDFGHVRATIKGIDELFNGNIPFDYVILLTGQDYPLKSNVQIEEFFKEHEGKSFIEYFPLPSAYWENGGLERIKYWHFHVLNRYFKLRVNRTFPKGFRPYGGSSYWCLPRVCIEYMHKFIQQNPGFVDFFKRVEAPDEIFFQTIILNSPFRDTTVNDNLRYIDWKEPNGASPSILCKYDFTRIAKSHKLFARKFDPSVDADILDMIDRQLLAVAA